MPDLERLLPVREHIMLLDDMEEVDLCEIDYENQKSSFSGEAYEEDERPRGGGVQCQTQWTSYLMGSFVWLCLYTWLLMWIAFLQWFTLGNTEQYVQQGFHQYYSLKWWTIFLPQHCPSGYSIIWGTMLAICILTRWGLFSCWKYLWTAELNFIPTVMSTFAWKWFVKVCSVFIFVCLDVQYSRNVFLPRHKQPNWKCLFIHKFMVLYMFGQRQAPSENVFFHQ